MKRPQHVARRLNDQRVELADIIRQHKTSFIQKHQPLGYHQGVLSALEKCRTAALGGHVDECDSCGHLRISYNSCRNRHCPKCQGTSKERWILAREQGLLPVSYFHIVFTLPQQLNTWCLHYPKQMYDLLFSSSWQTIKSFAHDQKHLGAAPGMISVLHIPQSGTGYGDRICRFTRMCISLYREEALLHQDAGKKQRTGGVTCSRSKP